VRTWVAARGVWAPLVFVGIQILQVIVFVIPGEIPQAAGGFLFGVAGGVSLSSLGIIIGSVCNYAIGRLLGRPFIYGIVGKEKTDRFLGLIGEGRLLGSFFLLFLIPGIPKDALCYIAGISGIRVVPFMLLSGLGRLPGLLGSAIIGGAAAQRNWTLAAALFSVSIAVFVVGLLFRRSLEEWIRKIMRK